MDFEEYQKQARSTAFYMQKKDGKWYPYFGLTAEVGEFLNKLKKTIRDEKVLDNQETIDELGDVLWYLSNIASDLNIPLDAIAKRNVEKLSDRQKRGVLTGNGDNR